MTLGPFVSHFYTPSRLLNVQCFGCRKIGGSYLDLLLGLRRVHTQDLVGDGGVFRLETDTLISVLSTSDITLITNCCKEDVAQLGCWTECGVLYAEHLG